MRKRVNLLFVAAAIVAFCGMQVAQASAFTKIHTESTPTWAKGSQQTQNVFTVSGGTLKCSVAEFKSSEAISTTSTTELTIHPTYGTCSAFGQGITVSTASCSISSTITILSGEIHLHLGCTAGTSVLLHGSTTGCSVSIGEQTRNNALTEASSGSGATAGILSTVSATGIVYTSSGGACGASGSNGTYSGSALINGFKSASFSEQHGISVE